MAGLRYTLSAHGGGGGRSGRAGAQGSDGVLDHARLRLEVDLLVDHARTFVDVLTNNKHASGAPSRESLTAVSPAELTLSLW